jgi:prepilin-type N-terminal cleavage/methylation domain-containing protein
MQVLKQLRSRIDYEDKNLVQKGFTLVELLVVIVILGVLAAVVVFAVGGITNSSKSSACKIEVRTINTATQAYYANGGSIAYPAGPVTAVVGNLVAAKLLSSGTGSASSAFSPSYDATTGVYAATCP